MKAKYAVLLVISLLAMDSVVAQSKKRFKKPVYQEIDFEDMVRRYYGKEIGSFNRLEGIYSVSCVITKQSKNFITGADRVRVMERKDNYARVAILKDWPDSKRDFIEVSLSYHVANKYPIMGELSSFAENGFIYKHLEPDRSTQSYSMTTDSSDLLEGEHSETYGRKTITYKLSYLKIYPKIDELSVDNH